MRRELLIAEAARGAWALEPDYGAKVYGVLARWHRGERASELELETALATKDARAARRPGAGTVQGGIAVLPLTGVIVPKAGLMTEYSGGTSCQTFTNLLRDAVANDGVDQILVDIDSPGGSVNGVPELASEIMQARTVKPVIGIANHQAASAAYWIGSCCSQLFVSPSGEVGSIGVYTMHQDVSGALEKDGVKTTLVSAGKYKTEASPYSPLSADAKDYMTNQVNEYYRSFVTAVARGRGVPIDRVKSGFGEGRMVTAAAAQKEGMVDGIASFDALVHDMLANPRSARTTRAGGAGQPVRIRSLQANRNTITLLDF